MIALIYEYTGDVTRSITRARLVAEVPIDEVPDDQVDFAREHGGDFMEVVQEAFA